MLTACIEAGRRIEAVDVFWLPFRVILVRHFWLHARTLGGCSSWSCGKRKLQRQNGYCIVPGRFCRISPPISAGLLPNDWHGLWQPGEKGWILLALFRSCLGY